MNGFQNRERLLPLFKSFKFKCSFVCLDLTEYIAHFNLLDKLNVIAYQIKKIWALMTHVHILKY